MRRDAEASSGKQVVRVLSFYKKSEDGEIITVTPPMSSVNSYGDEVRVTPRRLEPNKSFTSIDLKKARRSSSLLRKESSMMTPTLPKSCSFSSNDVMQRMEPETCSYNTLDTRINPLILRVSSFHCEDPPKKVYPSIFVHNSDGKQQELEIANYSNGIEKQRTKIDSEIRTCGSVVVPDGDVNLKKSESTASLIPVTPRVKQKFRHRDFTANGTLNIPSNEVGADLQEQWRVSTISRSLRSSNVGSTSLSNFSSGDGLSTSTNMGSTNRLVYSNKSKKRGSFAIDTSRFQMMLHGVGETKPADKSLELINKYSENLAKEILEETARVFISGFTLWERSIVDNTFYFHTNTTSGFEIEHVEGVFWARRIFITATKPIRFRFLDELDECNFHLGRTLSSNKDVTNYRKSDYALSDNIAKETLRLEETSIEDDELELNLNLLFGNMSVYNSEEETCREWFKMVVNEKRQVSEMLTESLDEFDEADFLAQSMSGVKIEELTDNEEEGKRKQAVGENLATQGIFNGIFSLSDEEEDEEDNQVRQEITVAVIESRADAQETSSITYGEDLSLSEIWEPPDLEENTATSEQEKVIANEQLLSVNNLTKNEFSTNSESESHLKDDLIETGGNGVKTDRNGDDKKLQFYIGDRLDAGSGIVNLGFEDTESYPNPVIDEHHPQALPDVNRHWCNWNGSISTSLSILSLAGSLGNLMRLPRMVYFHGGGIFLLTYTLITLMFGIPLVFLEIGLGQFCQHGTVKIWRAVNLFRGVGYAKLLLSFITSLYYMIYMATALSLFTWSVKGPLPFSECNFVDENGTVPLLAPGDICLKSTFLVPVSEDPTWFGVCVVFLLLLWTLILICLTKRSRSYKQTVFFTFPIFTAILVALIVEASARSGNGISNLFTFHWSKLFNVQVWYFSFVQMFFSLQIGFGNISTCAGRIYPKSNAFRSAVILVVANLMIGIATVCVVYLWLGQLEEAGFQIPITNVPELFMFSIIYSVASNCIQTLPTLWASLGYLLLLSAGLSSVMTFAYTVSTAIAIEAKKKWNWCFVSGCICLGAFTFGVLAMIPEYQSLPHVLDHYVVSRTVIALTCMELVGFAYVYGCKNLYNDLEFVIGERLSRYWKIIWTILPVTLLVVEICSLCLLPLDGEAPVHDQPWKYSLGWSLYLLSWCIIVTCAGYQIYIQVDYNLPQKFLSAIKPSRNWGPVDPIYRHCWVQWRNRYHMTGQKDFSLKRRGTRDYTHSVRAATDSVGSVFEVSGFHPSMSEWIYKRSSPAKSTPTNQENILWGKEN